MYNILANLEIDNGQSVCATFIRKYNIQETTLRDFKDNIP